MKSLKLITSKVGSSSGLLHQITEEEKNKLQQVLLGMLLDIKAACDKMGVTFTLMGGSALGAVRHKGFIPWDDDIDIAMFRSEWEKFKEGFDTYMGDKYVLEAPNYQGKDTKYPLAKIFLKGSEFAEAEELNFPYHNCIFIDAFVIDNVSDNTLIRNVDAVLSDIMRVAATCMNEYRYPNDLIKKIMNSTLQTHIYYNIRRSIGFCLSWISHRIWCNWFDNYISRHPNHTKLTTVATGHKRYRGETIRRDIWLPFSKGVFCGVEFNLPHKVHEYLTEIYGSDYMKLPPFEKRELHPIAKLSFPKNI